MAVDVGTLLAHIGLDTSGLNSGLTKSKKLLSSFTGAISSAAGPLLALTGATGGVLGLAKGLSELGDATKLAARIEVMSHVLVMTGKNAGYTASELKKTQRGIQALGIATQEAIQIEQLFIQAQLDVADAGKLARAAQDLAVISGQNSSEAAQTLTQAIVAQRPILLKQFGIIANLDDIYERMAKSLGKNKTALTEQEKRQGFFNEIMRQSAVVAGSYETAMADVGKQMTSLPRYFADASAAVGQHFLPVMRDVIGASTKVLKSITEMFESVDDATAKFYASRDAFESNAESTLALADRYDTLASKSNRSADEQRELETIIDRLTKIMPASITQWDESSTAIGINTEKIRANIENRQALFRVNEAETIKKWRDEWNNLTSAVAELEDQRNRLTEPGENLFPSLANNAQDADQLTAITDEMGGSIAKQHARMSDLLIALSQGYDALNDYGRAEKELGSEIATGILLLQQREQVAKTGRDANDGLAESIAITADELAELSRVSQQFALPDFQDQFNEVVRAAEQAAEAQKRLQEGLPTKQAEVYKTMLEEGQNTGRDLTAIWESYAALRVAQIHNEAAVFRQAGAEELFIQEAVALRLRELDAERVASFGEAASLMKQISEDLGAGIQQSLANSLFNWFEGRIEGIRGLLLSFADQVFSVMAKIASEQLATQLFNIVGSIPGFASGGIVTQPTLALVGEAGPEAIVPLSGGGGSAMLDRLSTGGEGSSRPPVVVNISTPNPGAFQNSQSQLLAQVSATLRAAERNS